MAAFVAVIRRYAMSPPKLTRYAPIADVLHPIEIYLVKTRRYELSFAATHGFYRRLCQILHRYEPLHGDHRFHCGMAAVALAYVVCIILYFYHSSELLKLFDYSLSRLESRHSAEFPAVLVYMSVVCQNAYYRQIVAHSNFEVVRIVSRRYLDRACTKFLLYVLISHNRYGFAHYRQYHILSYQILISLVVRMHRDSRIAQHCFRSGRSYYYAFASVLRRISDVPEMAALFRVLYLCVRESRPARRAPVYDSVSPIYFSFFVQTNEHLSHGAGASFIHCKSLSAPIAGAAQLFQLSRNGISVFFFPLPRALQKFLPAYVVL